MCKKCAEIDNLVKLLMGITPEEYVAEENAKLDNLRNSVQRTLKVTDTTNLHLIKDIPQIDHANLVNWIRRISEVAPPPGNVDIFAPFMRDNPNEVGSTVRVNSDGHLAVDNDPDKSKNRIMILSPVSFLLSGTAADADPGNPNWFMPVSNQVTNLYYTFVHEWGHVTDIREHDDIANNNRVSQMVTSVDLSNPDGAFARSLSGYAESSEPEAYAEAFTEWHISKGRTNNFAACWYAKEYGWHTYDNSNNTNHDTYNSPVLV